MTPQNRCFNQSLSSSLSIAIKDGESSEAWWITVPLYGSDLMTTVYLAAQAQNTWCVRQLVYIENCMVKSPIVKKIVFRRLRKASTISVGKFSTGSQLQVLSFSSKPYQETSISLRLFLVLSFWISWKVREELWIFWPLCCEIWKRSDAILGKNRPGAGTLSKEGFLPCPFIIKNGQRRTQIHSKSLKKPLLRQKDDYTPQVSEEVRWFNVYLSLIYIHS